jgi:hypothetical protein
VPSSSAVMSGTQAGTGIIFSAGFASAFLAMMGSRTRREIRKLHAVA